VEAFGFDQGLAVEAESTFAAVLCGVLENTVLGTGGGGEDEELSVREDAVNVEEQQFDFASAGLSGEFRHRGKILAALREYADPGAFLEMPDVVVVGSRVGVRNCRSSAFQMMYPAG
jgi:hypothetical protein